MHKLYLIKNKLRFRPKKECGLYLNGNKKEEKSLMEYLLFFGGWQMGLEPTTFRTTI